MDKSVSRLIRLALWLLFIVLFVPIVFAIVLIVSGLYFGGAFDVPI